MRFICLCGLLSTSFFLSTFLSTGLIFAAPAHAEETETRDKIEEIYDRATERFEQIKERARTRREALGDNPYDPAPFWYASAYGGLGATADDMIDATDPDGSKISASLDIDRSTGVNSFDSGVSFIALAGGWGYTFRREIEGREFRLLYESRLLGTGKFKATLDDQKIEASIRSIGFAPVLEAIFQQNFSLHSGLGISLSSIDVDYADADPILVEDKTGLDLYYSGGARYYTGAAREGGSFVELRVEVIFPLGKHWPQTTYVAFGVGAAY